MEKVRYYFGWFTKTIPQHLADILNNELVEKKSLVIISTAPSDAKYSDDALNLTRDIWFEPAGLVFEQYHSIDYRIRKEDAQSLLRNASAVLLHGGYADLLKGFLAEYEMVDAIMESTAAVVMGASAGGMNMGAKFAYGKWIDDSSREPAKIYDGIGFDNFAFRAHSERTVEGLKANDLVKAELIPMSHDLDVYAVCEESTLRVKDGKLDVFGDVFLISGGKIEKM
ncbi:MAG: Type 1 glutamine amidotransferase-like domain-containing protein [Defluviitaleaceae bacterium]|nr:Type 1 glutamine amidotransferase-like domain-containing protein [Defluviitaleaceae bacterium]